MDSFTKLKAWQRAMYLMVEVHQLTKRFPKNEEYELVKHLRAAAKSVVSNIVEGSGRILSGLINACRARA